MSFYRSKFLFQLIASSNSCNILRLVSIRISSDNWSINGNKDSRNISLPFLSLHSFKSRKIVHLFRVTEYATIFVFELHLIFTFHCRTRNSYTNPISCRKLYILLPVCVNRYWFG